MKKILSVLSTLSLTTLVSTTVIACNNQDESQIGIMPILNEILAKLEKETAFNPYDWTKDTLDETIKSNFLNYLQTHVKNFDLSSITSLKILRDNMFNQIIININYKDTKQNFSQPYFIKTGILLEGATNNA